jgi:menaquinone-specific isochorismate synthase
VKPRFAELLAAASTSARNLEEDGVLSLAVPLAVVDPLPLLPLLPSDDGFRFLWDGAPGLCLAAAGRCQSLELSGPRRFELAQRFASLALGRLISPGSTPALARPRVLLAFAFFDTASTAGGGGGVPGVQAVLPQWQLSRHGQHCWLRLQRPLGGGVTARSLAEELWEQAQALEQQAGSPAAAAAPGPGERCELPRVLHSSNWQGAYSHAAERALELIHSGELQKLVLAVRQELLLDRPLDPLQLLGSLRQRQSGSCRLLWQRQSDQYLVGASPERLLTVRQGQLRSDALAGTAGSDDNGSTLLASSKDRHEHELVIDTISTVLSQLGLEPRRPRRPRVARHGHLLHLHTPITAAIGRHHPLALAEALHPTPAVAGLPRRQSLHWLRTLEPFERGQYAAPIGWIDSEGDADLRVAIRCGVVRGHQLELCAGAGLVRGSALTREVQEVGLKLRVLQDQLNLRPTQASTAQSR